MQNAAVRKPNFYNSVWRWHFYAGLVCVPFVIWLALTGSIYLWRPQIEAWLDRPYDALAAQGPVAAADAQVAAAIAAVPGSRLNKYLLPPGPDAAVRILVERDDVPTRVYVDPRSLDILQVVPESRRPFNILSSLHGMLLAGTAGSIIVEIAACWAIVMLLTGLYLWWPRGTTGWAGIVYPRLRARSRVFWRDIHATAGIWVSFCALFLILTGLPWAKAWGGYLDDVRSLAGARQESVDWTIGGKAPPAAAHAEHMAMAAMAGMTMPGDAMPPGALAHVIATVAPLGIAAPVAIAPPKTPGAPWRVTSDSADRPLRSKLAVDGDTGRIVSRSDFADGHWIDRTVGYGIAIHEGQHFGVLNQIIGTLTALFLVILAVSGTVMWWRRRPVGLLGAPIPLGQPRFGVGLVAIIIALGLYMPLFGATLLVALLAEKLVLGRLPATRQWLGLRQPGGPGA